MRKYFTHTIVIIIGTISIVLIYMNSTYYVKKQEWKYGDGIYIGDWLSDANMKIKGRVIYSDKGNAEIVFCYGRELIIRNIQTNEKGYYINKK